MRVELQNGYVLHTRPYRDNSLLVEFFSRDYGRVSLVARGAKGRKTRGGSVAALLQPFQAVSCAWSGRGELKTLTGCESPGSSTGLAGKALFSGLYVNELVVRLLHHEDPHPVLFDRYHQVVDELGGSLDEELALRGFEFALLQQLGYGFALDLDGRSGEPLASECWYHYHPDYGLVQAAEPVNDRLPRYQGCDLQDIAQGISGAAGRKCAKQLMRQVLATHLGEKPLRSRELFRRP
jgi:DNA repair protein RecO (recombination protein O)